MVVCLLRRRFNGRGIVKDNGRWEHCDSLNSCKAIHIHERFCLAHLAMTKGTKRKDRKTRGEITDAEKEANEADALKALEQQEQDEAEARKYPACGTTVRHLLRDPDRMEGLRDLIGKRCKYAEEHYDAKVLSFFLRMRLRSAKSRKYL